MRYYALLFVSGFTSLLRRILVDERRSEKKIRTVPEQRIIVDCSDGSRVELSQEASEQIRTARFRYF